MNTAKENIIWTIITPVNNSRIKAVFCLFSKYIPREKGDYFYVYEWAVENRTAVTEPQYRTG